MGAPSESTLHCTPRFESPQDVQRPTQPDVKAVQVSRFTRLLIVKGDRQPFRWRCPTQCVAAELVTGFVLDADDDARAVLARQHVPERIQIAGQSFRTPLRCTLRRELDASKRVHRADLHVRERTKRKSRAQKPRVIAILTFILHPAHEHREAPRAEPAQPLGLEGHGRFTIDRHRRDRARVAREEQAAVPARTPPAIEFPDRQEPISQTHRAVGAVESPCQVIVWIRHPRERHPPAEPRVRAAQARTDFSLFARRVFKRAQNNWIARGRRVCREARGVALEYFEPLLDAGQRRALSHVSAPESPIGLERLRDVSRGNRPRRERDIDHARIDQVLQVVPERAVAGIEPGLRVHRPRKSQEGRNRSARSPAEVLAHKSLRSTHH